MGILNIKGLNYLQTSGLWRRVPCRVW